ncbi:MAG: hypothetical protein MUE42_08460 [Opitutaceae bacterium]|jgi:autotransporter-associated beta strand protein|nr:hypothetical protein [Opitutaceae bacterium]
MKTHPSTVSAPVYSRSHYKAAGVLLAAMVVVSAASAQILTKASNNENLNVSASWSPAQIPGSSNTLEFTSTWTGAQVQMGASLDIAGISYTNVANNNGRISGTGAQTLSLGSVGVDLTGAGGNLRIDPALVLTANQEWSIASGRILNLTANGVTGAFTAQLTGAGTLAFDATGTGTYGNQFEVDVATLRINSDADVTLTNPNNSFTTLNLFRGIARFSSISDSATSSAAGAFTTASLGGNNTNGLFYYTGTTTSTNRNFQVDRRSAASGILVSSAGQTLTISGGITHNAGNDTGVANNAFRVGGDGNLVLSGVIADNSNGSFTTSLAKEGGGTLTLSNANTFLGGVSVGAGTLVVSNTTGSGTGSGLVTVSGLAAVGGNGTIGGSLTLNTNARFSFDPASTLKVTGTVTLPTSFGIDDLLGLSSSTAFGTYTIFDSATSVSYTSISNLGLENFAFLGGDRNAYFQFSDGGTNLQVVVASAIPEPSAFAVLAGLAALGFSATRRRRRAG